MIVKRLRQKNNWSQEQLATMSGLSVRTIQRVESGQSASLETLKSLASVFETDVSKLTEEITVIDKKSEKWKEQPAWFKFLLLGICSRKVAIFIEIAILLFALVIWAIEGANDSIIIALLGAYTTAIINRYADNKGIWDI